MRKLGALLALMVLLLGGCDFYEKNAKEVVVAECYGAYLYASDLKGIVPEGTNVYDSLQRVNDFIDAWIMRRVLIHQAENNLNKEDLDLKKQLAEEVRKEPEPIPEVIENQTVEQPKEKKATNKTKKATKK